MSTKTKTSKQSSHPNATKARQFRLGENTLSEIDYLMARLGLSSRADIIRHLVRRAAIEEGYK